MTCLKETNQLLKSSRKRLFAVDEHAHTILPPVKGRTVDSVRSFPKFCGPLAPGTTTSLSCFEDSSVTDTTGSPVSGVAIAAVPLTILAPPGVRFDFESPHTSFQFTEQSNTLRKHGSVKFEASASRDNDELSDNEDDDCVIIVKNNDNCRGSNDGSVDLSELRNTPSESPLESNVHDCSDDTEVHILSPLEWSSKQYVCKRQKRSENDIAAEPETQQKLHRGECNRGETVEVDSDGTTFGSDEKVEHGEDLKDLSIVCYGGECDLSASRQQVLNARKLFDELCNKLLEQIYQELKGGSCHVYNRAASLLKNQKKWVNTEPRVGHVPGIEIGDQFGYRAELVVVGLHHQFMAGINWMKINGKKCAISIVDSGRYENKTISADSFVYSGHGGNEKVQRMKSGIEKAQKTKSDQKLVGGNLALKNSMDENCAVRVIRKHIEGSTGKHIYIYEGLYTVSNFWLDRLQNDHSAYMFEMIRLPNQPDYTHHLKHQIIQNEQTVSKVYLVHPSDDLSNGKEKIPIRVVNEINKEKPPHFTYITEMKYPDWNHLSSLSGCDCINGCSDSELCRCGIKNGGELPFNEEGRIVKVKRRLVRECGPSCKCPPSCPNRVSQHGIRYRLEVFKTESTGWGIRSLDAIPSGGFICEYVGELLKDMEAEQRINDDEYLFDLDNKDGFTIDALTYGNVGRFINHSCSPNLYAQKVLYDNPDERTPHIMFFATEDLPPLNELTYDYNYTIGRVCDAFGNIKIKSCHCGSHECTGRLY